MPDALTITDFRRSIASVFSDAVQRHRPAKIRRSNREQGVLLSAEDFAGLIAQHEFHPRVYRQEGSVNVWLPEFQLYGRGGSFAEAKADLVEEVEDYVDEYIEDADLYLRAPNRAHHYPYVLKAWLTETPEELEALLFAEPHQTTGEAAVPA